ncbi:MAG: hypothetical protein OXE83_08430 [Gammaproteobacteria bacterium]|nr:hypothetical protein [Gammaproteobacteria bacterium]
MAIETGDHLAFDLDEDGSLHVSPIRSKKPSLRGLLSGYAKGGWGTDSCGAPRASGSEVRGSLIAFDANVLLRLLLDDDPPQARKAKALLEQTLSKSDKV